MLVNFAKKQYSIAAGLTLSGRLKQERHLQVTRGRIWLTIEGQDADFWLQSGESMKLPAHSLLVMQAEQEESEMTLCGQACPTASQNQGPYRSARNTAMRQAAMA